MPPPEPPNVKAGRMIAGKPVKSAMASASSQVVAIFPWGETRPFVLDPTSGYWQCRFLVPRDAVHGRYQVVVLVTRADGTQFTFTVLCRIDTANEVEYFMNGGILHYVLRKLAA